MSKSTIRVVHEGSFNVFDECTQEVDAIIKAAAENEATLLSCKIWLEDEQIMHWYDVHYYTVNTVKTWKYKVVTHRNA
jgi:regulator of sigma D